MRFRGSPIFEGCKVGAVFFFSEVHGVYAFEENCKIVTFFIFSKERNIGTLRTSKDFHCFDKLFILKLTFATFVYS